MLNPLNASDPVSTGHLYFPPARPPLTVLGLSSCWVTFMLAHSATPAAWDNRSTARARAADVFFSSSAEMLGTPRAPGAGSNVGSAESIEWA